MREFAAYNIYQWDNLIEEWLNETNKPIGTVLTKKRAKIILKLLDGIIGNQCEELGWADAEIRMSDLAVLLNFKLTKKLPTAESIHTALYELQAAIQQ